MSALPLTMTTLGLERFTAAQIDDDIDLTISSIGLTAAAFVPAPSLTALPGQFRNVDTISGDQVGESIVHLLIRDDASLSYTVRGFGLFLADGTLFAVYGQEEPIFEKAEATAMLIALDMAFPSADIDALNFGDTNFLNPPATLTRKGVVELATEAEAVAGEDHERAITPAALKAAIQAAIDANDRIGTVKLWWGEEAEIADGWAICNGQTVPRSDGAGNITTPDMRDRVPSGVSEAHELGAKYGAFGKTVDTSQNGGHAHDIELNLETASASTGVSVATTTRGLESGNNNSSAIDSVSLNDPNHAHDVQVEGQTGQASDHSHSVTIDVAQPSIALHFIMRI